MTNIFLASITTQACWWISKNPSYVLWPVLAGLIVFAVVTYMLIKAKNQNNETYANYLRVYYDNNSNIVKIKSLKTNVRDLSRDLTSARKAVAELQEKLTRESSKYQGLSEKYENTKKEIAPLRMQLGKEHKKTQNLSTELYSRNGEIHSLQQQISVLEKACADNKILKRKVTTLQNDIETEREKTTQLAKELELETVKLEKLKTKYDENFRQLSPLRMRLGKAQKAVSMLMEELDSTKSENAFQQKRIEELESDVAEKDAVIIERTQTISKKENILSEKNQTIADNVERIKELEAKIASSTSNNSNVEELEKERDLLIEQLESANSERDIKGKALKEQTSLAETRGKEIERITEELRKANDIINALNAKVIQLTALLDTPTGVDSAPEPEENEEQIPTPDTELETTTEEKPIEETPGTEEQEPKQETEDQPKEDTIQESTTSSPSEESSTVTSVSAPSTTTTSKGRYVVKKHVRPIEEADEDVDLPVIENKTGYVKRSILQVIDVEQEEEELIDADEFFSRTPEEIANVARMLAEAAESGREAYICACCKTPVKISKRDFGSKEVLFFSHCTQGVVCDWKQEHGLISKSGNVFVESEGEPYDGKARYREIKGLIVESLMSGKSRGKGISDVEADKKIRSQHKFMYSRTAGVYAKFNNKDLVIELQTKDVHMNTVVEKDMFYRLNDHNVMWVFGADEGGGYDFINKHVPKSIMFANKRNVFILDKQAIEACENRMELVLKCNYLDPDGRWHYRKEKQGVNGILVTLDELSFDEDLCKAYYYDANEEYFNANPDIKKEYYDSIVSKEKLLKDLKDTWEGKVVERRKKLSRKNTETVTSTQDTPKAATPVIPISPVKKEEPVKIFTGYSDRYIYSLDGKKGVVDGLDNFIIPCEYSDIQVWTRGKYRVKKIDLWGVMDESRKLIVDIKYNEIGKLNNGKAPVKTSTESYYIYENGTRVLDEAITLQNGWIKFRQGQQWGISDSEGNIVVDCIYDEIGSFRGRLIGFYKGKFQKLKAQFEYRMKISCNCINNNGNRANYEVNGVKMLETLKQTAIIGMTYSNKQINNISFTKSILFVSTISDKTFAEKIDHIDRDIDFQLGEVVNVTIDHIKLKKIFLKTSDSRQTYITKSVLSSEGVNIEDIKSGISFKLKKTGFDNDVERTIWKYVK